MPPCFRIHKFLVSIRSWKFPGQEQPRRLPFLHGSARIRDGSGKLVFKEFRGLTATGITLDEALVVKRKDGNTASSKILNPAYR